MTYNKIRKIRYVLFPKGQTIIELVLVMGLAAILLPALLTSFSVSRDGTFQQKQRGYAAAYLKEVESAVKSIKSSGWSTVSSLTVGSSYHTEISSNKWIFVPGESTPDANGIKHKVVVSSVNRDATGAIVQSPAGSLDPSTKRLDITISWTKPSVSSIVSSLYLTRTENNAYTETTLAQFNLGTKSNTVAVTGVPNPTPTPGDGQIQLASSGGSPGGGDWCQPNKSIKEIDLPKNGVANAITAIAGPASDESTIFAGTGENASGVSFAKVNAPGAPPNPLLAATFSGYKTNTVFGEANYAYLATDNNAKEVVIMSLTQFSDSPINSNYLEVGSINLPGNINATRIYVTNNKAFILGSDKRLYIYDITNRAFNYGTADYLGKVAISGLGKKIIVNGSYAYIATDATANQFQIANIANPSNPTIIGQLTLGNNQTGIDVFVDTLTASPTRAYFISSALSPGSDFFIIDISTKNNPKLVTGYLGYDTNGMNPTGITVTTGNIALIVGKNGSEQYQVIRIDNETLPTKCAGLQYSSGINGIASVLQSSGYAYSYIVTGDSNYELKIILGGAGEKYSLSGVYESPTFDAGSTVAFNRFVASINQPTGTSMKLQVATSPPNLSDNCNSGITFTYLGPNGTSDSNDQFYVSTTGMTQLTGLMPLINYPSPTPTYKNPGRCMRYKAIFSTNDNSVSPALFNFSLNYSQ